MDAAELDRPEKVGRLTGLAKSLVRVTNLDFHIFATLIFRAWSIVAGGVTILLIPVFLTAIQQGYYYTFASILGMQIFFELGMSQVVVQLVAHEAAHLTPSKERGWDGPQQNKERLQAIAKLLRNWYSVAALIFVIAAGIAGITFFRAGELIFEQWGYPWLLLVVATAGNLWLSWRLAFMEGFSFVGQVSRMRLIQSVFGYVLMWCALVAGGGLWVVAALPMANFVITCLWLSGEDNKAQMKFGDDAPPRQGLFSWRTEVFPFQWRIALSWISGFFIFQLFAPLAFKYHGAVAAGQIGLAITMLNAVGIVGSSWVSAKVPAISQLISQAKNSEAKLVFVRLLKITLAFVLILCLVAIAVIYVIKQQPWSLANRLPSVWVFAVLSATQIGNSFVTPAATYMRAHKEEPMLTQSVCMAVLTAALGLATAAIGPAWPVISYAILVWLVSVPWTAKLLKGYFAKAR